ncbi:uncharacterized protein LOC144453841 [Glandiceps talaboti]
MAFLSPPFSGDLAFIESHHTRAAIIPSAFYSTPTLPPFYNNSFASNFINFASALHGPRYAAGATLNMMEREHQHNQQQQQQQKQKHSLQQNANSKSSTSTGLASSSSSSKTAASSAASPSAAAASAATASASTSHHCSTSFSIDSILGRTDSKESDKDKITETAQESDDKTDLSQIASTSHGGEESADSSDPMTRFSWLQCTRYKPPRLPRVKKKDGTKKRKLGRNPRVPFSAAQVAMLEQKFRRTHYLSSVDVAELSAALNLSENRVKIWFQNRRARERRDRENMEKSGARGISWSGPSANGNPAAQFSQAVQEGTSAFTPVSYNY